MKPSITTGQTESLDAKHLELVEARLSTYAELLLQLELIEAQLEEEKGLIGAIVEHAGLSKAESEHFTMSWTRGSTIKSLDPQKLIMQGVTTAQIENATVEKPRKDYFQIRRRAKKG